MIERENSTHPFLDRLRRSLPISAHARHPLLGYLQSKRVIGSTSPILRVVNVFFNDYDGIIMCQFTIDGDDSTRIFVAPLTQLALSRKHPPRANPRR